jgi:hypothetical protein
MYRRGCPVHDLCMDFLETACEAVQVIQRHPWDQALTDLHGLPDRRWKRLGGSHVHSR